MNYINALFDHDFHRWENAWNIEARSQTRSARSDKIGDSNKPRVRNTLDCVGVKLADVACSNQSDPEICIQWHSGFPSNLVGVAIDLLHPDEWSSQAFAAGKLNYEASIRGPRMALEDSLFCPSTDLDPERWIFNEPKKRLSQCGIIRMRKHHPRHMVLEHVAHRPEIRDYARLAHGHELKKGNRRSEGIRIG